jgi:hypothetical protein
MAWSPKTFDISDINNGKKYKPTDGVIADDINKVVEGAAYAQALAMNEPIVFEEEGDNKQPSVSIDTSTGLPRFKFMNIKGEAGTDHGAEINELRGEIQRANNTVEDNANRLKAISSVLADNDMVVMVETTDTYSARQTANGEEILDGACEVKKIVGDTVASQNLFNVSLIEKTTDIEPISGGSLKIPVGRYNASTQKTLGVLCPFLRKGDTVRLDFYTTTQTSSNNIIYLSGANIVWGNGETKEITSEMLNSTVLFYGDSPHGTTDFTKYKDVTISNIQITKGTEKKLYEPYFDGFLSAKVTGITSCGKNLFTYPYTSGEGYIHNGITFTNNKDGSITIKGTATNGTAVLALQNVGTNYAIQKGKKYNLKVFGSVPQSVYLQINYLDKDLNTQVGFLQNWNIPTNIAPEYDTLYTSFLGVVTGTEINTTIYPVLYEGDEDVTAFEPYKQDEYLVGVDSLGRENYIDVDSQRLVEKTRIVDIATDCDEYAFAYNGASMEWVFEDKKRYLYTTKFKNSNNYGRSTLLSSINHISTSGMSDTTKDAGVYIANNDGSGVYLWFDKDAFPEFDAGTKGVTEATKAVNKFVKDNNFQVLYYLRSEKETPISIPKTYMAYNKGGEFIKQDTRVVRAMPTITQEYFGKVGGNNE